MKYYKALADMRNRLYNKGIETPAPQSGPYEYQVYNGTDGSTIVLDLDEENNKWTLTRTLKGEKTPIERLEGFWDGEDPEPEDEEWYQNNPRRTNPVSAATLLALGVGFMLGKSKK